MELSLQDTFYGCAVFTALYGDIYYDEGLAHRCYEQGHIAPDHVAAAMKSEIESGEPATQIALLNAYPFLTYKIAEIKGLSDSSRREQKSVGLDQCTEDEAAQFERLNMEYKEKFGFPFIIAVRVEKNRHAILEKFKERINNGPETELRNALDAIHVIADFRIKILKEAMGIATTGMPDYKPSTSSPLEFTPKTPLHPSPSAFPRRP